MPSTQPASVPDSVGTDSACKQWEKHNEQIVSFGKKHKGKFFREAYDDIGYRAWYIARAGNKNMADQQLKFGMYCCARSKAEEGL